MTGCHTRQPGAIMLVGLKEYGEKRDFTRTPEPPPGKKQGAGPLVFVVQKHAARRLHYDLRLEVDGVLKSWSLPKGPSLNPADKRLAVMVEDHPLDYRSFEGVIPKGEYGAGEVIVWDAGTYSPESGADLFIEERRQAQDVMREGLQEGKLKLTFRGSRLKGSWALVRMSGPNNNWLFIKHRDDFASADHDILAEDTSVLSGLSIKQISAGHLPSVDPDPELKPAELAGARRAPFPTSVTPMLAYLTSAPPAESGWLYEPKLDGYRIVAMKHGGKVRLSSRHGLDVTQNYPELAAAIAGQAAREMVLDGEAAALDENGRPCFQCLQQYLKSTRSGQPSPSPLVYYAFDLLYLGGYELNGVPLLQRKKLLGQTVKESGVVRLIAYFEQDGAGVYRAATGQGLEGILAKRADSTYEPGQRSHSWLKVKATLSDDFVIGGYSPGQGNRAHSFGALLLGYYDADGKLVYSGNVGSGFDEGSLSDLLKRLKAIRSDNSPFAAPLPLQTPAVWVRPELVAEVKFAEWTQDGRLRQPVFLRLREDKLPGEVHRYATVPAHGEPDTKVENPLAAEVQKILQQIASGGDNPAINVQGHRIALTNLNKVLWPATDKSPALTKRHLITYLLRASPYLLPHLEDRPLTLKRYPDGINGEFFYQRHWDNPRPDFVETVSLVVEHEEGVKEFLMCNNLATLLWLGQLGTIEYHSWFSRISLAPEGSFGEPGGQESGDITDYPDFIIFDIDPYIYSGKEARGAEPELNPQAFAQAGRVALWLKEILDGLSLSSFIKTSGRTGLHIYVPINRRMDYRAVRASAGTIARFVQQEHPGEVVIDWAVEKRTGKVFIDYNQNVRGKTLGSVYAPRAAPGGTVSVPLLWDELGKIYPTDFNILMVPGRLAAMGDLWAGILDAKRDLQSSLKK